LVVSKIGESPVAGLTDGSVPRRLGPKRASNIRKLFNLGKDDDVRKYVISRTYVNKKGATRRKAPKIQRFTPIMLQRKRARKAKKLTAVKNTQADAATYKKLVMQRLAEKKDARRSMLSKRRSSRRSAKLAADAAPKKE